MPSVLFVCTGNQYRSPIAAGFFKRLLMEHTKIEGWSVGSAGTWTVPGQLLSMDAVQDAILLGVDMQGHQTQMVDKAMLDAFDLILVMEKGHCEALGIEFPESQERVHLLTEMVEAVPSDIPDPLFFPGEHYRVLRQMCDLIERGFARIVELAESNSRRSQ